jgi:dipeptidyl-peptidase-4
MTFVKSFFLIAGSIIIANSSFSQRKELTEKQMLRGEKTNITTSLPQVLGWTDDAHFLISSRVHPDSANKVFLVDCKTGKQTPSSVDILKKEPLASITVSVRNNDLFFNETGKPSKQLTNSKDVEINPTLSPDKKLVGFTRNNDLYTINLETGKENRITTDGTDLILNGYASWVYFEEILGRGSRFKSFWWSSILKPGSKVLLIIRSPCTSSIFELAKPPINASRTFAGSAPALDANTSASATASIFNATII